MSITIVSFGHTFGPAPTDAHLVVDLREHFHNPAPHLGEQVRFPDPRVIEHVMTTTGIPGLISALATAATALAAGSGEQDVVLAVGCAGGHHRAPTVAERTAQVLRGLAAGAHTIEVIHRDLETDDPDPHTDQDPEHEVDIDDPIEMPEGAVDFVLPARPRSTEDPHAARARLEALAEAWVGGFQAYDLAQALADAHGLTRPRAWILAELRRLEDEGRLECDDHGRWTPTT